jgi:hypothetical protein
MPTSVAISPEAWDLITCLLERDPGVFSPLPIPLQRTNHLALCCVRPYFVWHVCSTSDANSRGVKPSLDNEAL